MQHPSGSATPGRSSTYAVPTSPTNPVLPQAPRYASGHRHRWFAEHKQFFYYPCNPETGANLIKEESDWLEEAPPGYEPLYDSDIDYKGKKPEEGRLEDPEQQEESKQEDPQDQEPDTKEATMTLNLTQDVLQDMLNLALDTRRQKAINDINTIIGGLPGVACITSFNAQGVPSYAAPTPIPSAAGQPAAQQPTAQTNAHIRNEVHPPDGYDGRKEGYESFRRHLVQYINYVEPTHKVNTALSFFNKGTTNVWGRHYFTINERTILGGTHTMEDFPKAADKYFRDPRLEQQARQAILQTVPNRGELIESFFIRFDELLVVAKMDNVTGIADQQLVEHLYRVLPSALVLAINQDNHSAKVTAEQVIKNMRASNAITAQQATDIRAQNEIDNVLTYSKVKTLALQRVPLIARFCRDKYRSQLPTVLPRAFGGNHPYIRPFGAPSPQNRPAYAPVRGYAGGAYAAPDPDPMDTSRMAPPANKPFECYRCGGKDHLALNCTNKPKPGYKEPRLRQQRAVHFNAEDVCTKLSEMSVAEMMNYILEREEEIAHFTEEGMMAKGLDFGDLQ